MELLLQLLPLDTKWRVMWVALRATVHVIACTAHSYTNQNFELLGSVMGITVSLNGIIDIVEHMATLSMLTQILQ